MGSVGTYIQCAGCGATYGESVLSYDPEAEKQRLYLKLRGLLSCVALADGMPAEIRAIGKAYHEATGTPLPADVIESDLRAATAGKVQLGAYARPLAQQLNYQGKALFLRAAFCVLCAKGSPRRDAGAVISAIAQAMQISTEQVKQILG
jgi:hypothetical protein